MSGVSDIASGIGSLIGTGVSGILAPNAPTALGMSNGSIDQFYYGLNAAPYNKLQKLLALQKSGTLTPQQQSQLNELQTKSAQNAVLPKELAAQQAFMPQFEQEQQQLLASQTQALAGQYTGLTNQLNPQYGQIQSTVGNQINSQIGMGLNPQQIAFFGQQLGGQEAAMGLGSSPLGAQNTALALTGLDLQQQQQNTQNALSFSGAFPNPASGILGLGIGTSPSTTGLAGGSVTPQSLQEYQALAGAITGQNYGYAMTQSNALGGAVGQIGGGIAELALDYFTGGMGSLGSMGGSGGGGGMNMSPNYFSASPLTLSGGGAT